MLETFLIKLQAFSLQAFLKETPTQVLSCEVWEILKNTYFEEHLQTTASGAKKAVVKNFAIFIGVSKSE